MGAIPELLESLTEVKSHEKAALELAGRTIPMLKAFPNFH